MGLTSALSASSSLIRRRANAWKATNRSMLPLTVKPPICSIVMAGITCWARTERAATALTPPTTCVLAVRGRWPVLMWTIWARICLREAASWWRLPVVDMSVWDTSGCWTLAMVCKSSPVITRLTWTEAGAACWTFAPCFGKTDGRWAAIISKAARLKFSPRGAAMLWNWRWISYGCRDAVAALGHLAARVGEVRPERTRQTARMAFPLAAWALIAPRLDPLRRFHSRNSHRYRQTGRLATSASAWAII